MSPDFSKQKGRYPQARRLLKLYDRIFRREVISPRDLAPELGVSRRTVERDFEILRDVLDERLQAVEEPERGFKLVGQARKWPTTRWQVLAVVLGVRMTGFLSGRRFSTQVAPLISRLKQSMLPGHRIKLGRLERKIHVVRNGQKEYHRNPKLQELLETMVDGLLQEWPIDLEYGANKSLAGEQQRTRLRVYPLSLVLYRGAVYFIVDILGGDWNRDTTRILLSLDRIRTAKADEAAQHIPYPEDFSPENHLRTAFAIWTGSGQHLVRVCISPRLRGAVTERFWHETQRIEPTSDGGLEVTLEVGELREVANWVLGMGEDARVLGPPELIKEVKGRLKQALDGYST